jgi:hypothetical protein
MNWLIAYSVHGVGIPHGKCSTAKKQKYSNQVDFLLRLTINFVKARMLMHTGFSSIFFYVVYIILVIYISYEPILHNPYAVILFAITC